MNLQKFKKTELNQYYNNFNVIFFSYKNCFELKKENNEFIFKRIQTIDKQIKHTKKGRFNTFTKNNLIIICNFEKFILGVDVHFHYDGI